MSRARWSVVVAASVLAAPVASHADVRSDAEALFRAGEKAFAAAQYASAADAFDQAYGKIPLPAIAFSAAQAHRLQYFVDNQPQHLARATQLYRTYIDQQKTGGRVGDAVTALAEIEPLLRGLGAAGATQTTVLPSAHATRLVVTSDVPNARATIDKDSGPVPFVREVASGPHDITIAADGYATITRKATAVDGEMVPVEGAMVALPATIAVPAPSHAVVEVDGRHVGDVPLATADVPAGTHFIAVRHRGFVPYAHELALGRGAHTVIDAKLHRTHQRVASFVVLGAGGALAIGSGVAALLARSSHSNALSLHDQLAMGGQDPSVLSDYNRALADRNERLHATELLGGAAGVVLVTGALLYWFDNPSPEAPPIIAPAVGPTSAGVVIGGKF